MQSMKTHDHMGNLERIILKESLVRKDEHLQWKPRMEKREVMLNRLAVAEGQRRREESEP